MFERVCANDVVVVLVLVAPHEARGLIDAAGYRLKRTERSTSAALTSERTATGKRDRVESASV